MREFLVRYLIAAGLMFLFLLSGTCLFCVRGTTHEAERPFDRKVWISSEGDIVRYSMHREALAIAQAARTESALRADLGPPTKLVFGREEIEYLCDGLAKRDVARIAEIWVYDMGNRLELPENAEWRYLLCVGMGTDGRGVAAWVAAE